MQENAYFRLPETQRIMLDILFVYCRLNPDVSYRQGMHEILAPILFVVESDAIDLGQSSKAMGEDALIKGIFDAAHIEHDAFTLFGQVMQSAKNFYEQTTHQGAEKSIVSRSTKIFSDLLRLVDAELAPTPRASRHRTSSLLDPMDQTNLWKRVRVRRFAYHLGRYLCRGPDT